jgi:hypothetical protein
MKLTRRGEIVALLALGTVLTLFLLACFAIGQSRTTGLIEPTSTTCMEDMPCWDCTTMGNGVCGP